MGVFGARLFFVGFVGLTVAITYNALYLQPVRVPGLNAPAVAEAGQSGTGPAPTRNSDLVLAVQRELAERGYDLGREDGSPMERTALAIRAYQREHRLPETGKASDALLKHILLGESAIEQQQPASDLKTATVKTVEIKTVKVRPVPIPMQPAPAVKVPPATKSEGMIKDIQQVLADLGYTPGPIDGAAGSETRKAISAFEKDRGLKPSGEISPKLLSEMKRITGRTIAAGG